MPGVRSQGTGPRIRIVYAFLYDVHGNLAALESVISDARARGAQRWVVGGDVAAFGPWPAETVACLRALDDARWIRGNADRWLVDTHDLPADNPMAAAARACREALGPEASDRLASLPPSLRLDPETDVWHASPLSDMRSFSPEPAADETELLSGVIGRRVFFGHTHLQFRRTAQDGIELINPGSVGTPLDGDHRAAYALMSPDGTVELVRVRYDHTEAAAALVERHGDVGWTRIVASRLANARLTPA